MSKLSDALFSAAHSAFLVPLIWVSMLIFALDAFELWTPDYGRIVFLMVMAYWISVAFEVGRLNSWRRGR